MAIDTTSTLESLTPLEDDEYLKFKRSETERLTPPNKGAKAQDGKRYDPAPVHQDAAKETPPDSPKAETKVEEPARAPEAPKQDAQEKGKPVIRKRDAESTIAQKTREIYERDEKIAKLQRDLEEARRPQVKSEAPPQVTPPEPKPEPGLMKRSDFRKKYMEDHADPSKSYVEIQDAADDAYDEYREQQTTQRTKAQEVLQRLTQKRLESLKAHADFDQVVNRQAVDRAVQTLAPMAYLSLRDETDNPTEILYHLLSNPVELARIASLSPGRQVNEIFGISASLVAPPQETPKQEPATEYPQKVRPITRVPAPQRHVLGGGAAFATEGPDPLDNSYENWRAAEGRRTKKA